MWRAPPTSWVRRWAKIPTASAAGKPTYPSMFGLDESRRMAHSSIEQAKAALQVEALGGHLSSLADWVLARRHRRMIGRRLVHGQPQKAADRQRVRRAPRNPASDSTRLSWNEDSQRRGRQPRVERMARRGGQVRRRDPQRRLIRLARSHSHARQCSTTDRLCRSLITSTFTTGC